MSRHTIHENAYITVTVTTLRHLIGSLRHLVKSQRVIYCSIPHLCHGRCFPFSFLLYCGFFLFSFAFSFSFCWFFARFPFPMWIFFPLVYFWHFLFLFSLFSHVSLCSILVSGLNYCFLSSFLLSFRCFPHVSPIGLSLLSVKAMCVFSFPFSLSRCFVRYSFVLFRVLSFCPFLLLCLSLGAREFPAVVF